MKNSKKRSTKQLEKFSNIFMQLGLVLTLFIVYVVLEHQTEQTKFFASIDENSYVYTVDPTTEIIFRHQPKVKPKPEPPKSSPKLIDIYKKVDNDEVIEKVINLTDEVPEILDLDAIIEVKIPPKDLVEDVDFLIIEDAPVFKGCENLSKEENKKCFDKKMNQFVKRNFDTDLANTLGLQGGVKRIFTQFVIDKEGKITNIEIRAPHPKLKKEAQRIINKLPKFTPGMQRKKPVKVKYRLPILFKVE